MPVATEARRALIVGACQSLAVAALLVLEPVSVPLFITAVALQSALAALSIAGSLAATMLFLPLFHEPVQVSSSTVAASEMLLWATLVGAGAAVGVRRLAALLGRPLGPFGYAPRLADTWKGWRAIPLLPLVGLAMLVGIGALLLLVVGDSGARAAGLREWRWTLLEPLILVWLLAAFTRRQDDRLLVAAGLLGGGLLASLLGLGQLLDGGGVIAGDVRRIDGPFPHPNALALFLLRIVVFAGVLALLSRRARVAGALVALVAGAALLASFARSALVALVATAALTATWFDRRVRLAGAALVVVGVLAVIAVAGERMIGPSGIDSLALRFDIWESGLEMIRDRPLRGYGPDQFLYNYTPRYIEPTGWDERFTAHGHNFLIDAWVRLGIIGAAFALASVCWIALAASRVVRRPDSQRPLAAAAVMALAAATIQGMVDNGYFAHDLAMSAWLLAWLAFDSPSESPIGGP